LQFPERYLPGSSAGSSKKPVSASSRLVIGVTSGVAELLANIRSKVLDVALESG